METYSWITSNGISDHDLTNHGECKLGDTMFVQVHTDPLRVAALESMSPKNNWFYEKHYRAPVYVPQHEVLFGLFMATKRVMTNGLKGYGSLVELRSAYENNLVNIGERVVLNDKDTTYGRAQVEDILGTDLENILGNDGPINAENISDVIRWLESREDRVDRLRRLQNFGSTIATHVGLDSLPFDNIYGKSTKEIKAITESPEPVGVRVNKLKAYLEASMKAKINEDPDSNLSNLVKGSGRVKYTQLVEIYAPTMIIKDDKIIIDHSNVFEGLSQRAYTELAKNNRALLEMKNELTPVSGFDNRQLVNLQMRLTYRHIVNPNPDTKGVLVPRKFAIGRTMIDGTIIKPNNDMELVRVRSCINNPTNIIYKDEIDSTKMSVLDGSGIGCNFATALMEGVTQAALALKHGGSTIIYENFKVPAIESGTIKEINNEYILISGDHEYKYPITLYSAANVKLSDGDSVKAGDTIIFSTKRSEVDQALRNFNTLADTQVTGALGAKSKKILCYAPYSGKIHYDVNNEVVKIGNYVIPYEKDYLYYYPEGYDVKIGTKISTGIIDMKKYHEIVDDDGICYSVFYDALCTSLNKGAGAYNSEVVESLYKSIMSHSFSVELGNNKNPNYLERIYKGNTKGSFEDAIKSSDKGTISLEDTLLLPILMRPRNA